MATTTPTMPDVARLPGYETPPPVITHSQTNIPNWGGTGWSARLVPAECPLVAIVFGDDAADTWTSLLTVDAATVHARTELLPATWGPESAAVVEDAVRTARAGSRVAFVGPEPTILAAIAVAKRLGINDDELVSAAIGTLESGVADEGFSTDACIRPIFCARCHETYTAFLAVGDAFNCPVCGTHVAVYYHYSPLRGAYLARPTGEETSV